MTWIESPNAGELNTAARQNVLVITSSTPKTQEGTQLCSNASQQPQQLAKRKLCRLELTSLDGERPRNVEWGEKIDLAYRKERMTDDREKLSTGTTIKTPKEHVNESSGETLG